MLGFFPLQRLLTKSVLTVNMKLYILYCKASGLQRDDSICAKPGLHLALHLLVKYNLLLQNMQNSSVSAGTRCSNVPLHVASFARTGSSQVAGSGMWLVHERGSLLRPQVVILSLVPKQGRGGVGASLWHKPLCFTCFWREHKQEQRHLCDCMFGQCLLEPFEHGLAGDLGVWVPQSCSGTSPDSQQRHPLSLWCPKGAAVPAGSPVQRITSGWKRAAIPANVCISHVFTYFKTSAAGWDSFAHLQSPCLRGLFPLLQQPKIQNKSWCFEQVLQLIS